MTHPYRGLPEHRYWRQGVADAAARGMDQLDPVVQPMFRIGPDQRIATAGSCFARHLVRHLRLHGVEPMVTESAHPMLPIEVAEANGYRDFTARYGNIYTTRQLLQLMRRALGEFEPEEAAWRDANGRWIDPFRPSIRPAGFATEAELLADRARHLACVRRMLADLDVFVFTLGLTECWSSRADGAVFPVCPGASAGVFDASRYQLLNLGVEDVCADMLAFVDGLRAINPAARVILTVSPVPLVATACDRHVMVATALSKAVLRVAAERICEGRPEIAYFPSFEIITGHHARGAYFGPDLRSVTEAGVTHVMRLFLRHYLAMGDAASRVTHATAPVAASQLQRMDELVRAHCDEETLAE